MRSVWEKIDLAGSHAGRPEGIEHSVFLRKFMVISLVDWEDHVHDRAGNEHDHSRKQYRKP